MTEVTKEYPIKPMMNNILIEKVDLIKRTIVIEGGKDSENVARVLAVGPGRLVGDKIIPVGVSVGDHIVVGGNFNTYRAGHKRFMLMSENSVVAVITDLDAVLIEDENDKPKNPAPTKGRIIT